MLTFNFSILPLHEISHPLHQVPVYPNIHSQVEFFLLSSLSIWNFYFNSLVSATNVSSFFNFIVLVIKILILDTI